MSALAEHRKILALKAAEIMQLLTDINETEKTVSRLKNELQEMYEKIDDELDRETDKRHSDI